MRSSSTVIADAIFANKPAGGFVFSAFESLATNSRSLGGAPNPRPLAQHAASAHTQQKKYFPRLPCPRMCSSQNLSHRGFADQFGLRYVESMV